MIELLRWDLEYLAAAKHNNKQRAFDLLDMTTEKKTLSLLLQTLE